MNFIQRLTKNKVFKLVLRLLLSAAAIYLIWLRVDVDKALQYMRQMDWGFYVLAFLAFFVSRGFGAERVRNLYRTQMLNLHFWMNVKLYFMASFYNLFIPFVGGEGFKAIWLKKNYQFDYRSLVGSAFLDRLSGMGFLAVLTMVFFTLSSIQIDGAKGWFLLAVPLVLFGHFLFMKLFFNSYVKAWPMISLHSLVIQSLQVCTAAFIIMALAIPHAANDYIFIFMLSSFALILPFVGAREGVFVLGAEQMGLDPEMSLAIALLFYLITAANSLLGGVFLLFPSLMGKQQSQSS